MPFHFLRRASAVLAGAAAFTALPALAAPVSVSITSLAFAPGAGYGIDAAENGGTLLDLRFTAASNQSLLWNTSAGPLQFAVGSLVLQEPSANGGITGREKDDLDVSAAFSLPGLAAGALTVSGAGVVRPGPNVVDMVWQPIQIALAGIGLVNISFDPVSLTTRGQSLTQTATLSLLAPAPALVPEPATLTLAGLALGALALSRRRGKRADPA